MSVNGVERAEFEREIDDLRARLVFSEIVLRAVCNSLILRSSDPAVALERWRKEMFASLQFIDRAVGEREDRVWESMVTWLDEFFAALAARVETISKTRPPQ